MFVGALHPIGFSTTATVANSFNLISALTATNCTFCIPNEHTKKILRYGVYAKRGVSPLI